MFVGPTYVCLSCNRLLFKSGVKILKKEEIRKLFEANTSLLEMATSNQLTKDCDKCVFCHNCLKVISKDGKCPRMSTHNGLKLDEIPVELILSDPEEQLIALDLLFMKIFKLPSASRMRATKGKMVNVPLEGVDIIKTLNVLPRKFEESFQIPVNLKRKQSMIKPHMSAIIKPHKLIAAVTKLKQLGNIHYQFVPLDHNYTLDFGNTPEDEDDRENESSASGSESDDGNLDKDNVLSSVSEFQSDQNSNVCLIPNEIDTMVVENQTNEIMSKKKSVHQKSSVDISPGE